MVVCGACNGKGYLVGERGEEVCPECRGKGEQFPAADRATVNPPLPLCPPPLPRAA